MNGELEVLRGAVNDHRLVAQGNMRPEYRVHDWPSVVLILNAALALVLRMEEQERGPQDFNSTPAFDRTHSGPGC